MYHISLNFQHTQSYYIPKFCKCYKDSAGLDRFALAALERELWPRRPVHFFMRLPLILCCSKGRPAVARAKADLKTLECDTVSVKKISPEDIQPVVLGYDVWKANSWAKSGMFTNPLIS